MGVEWTPPLCACASSRRTSCCAARASRAPTPGAPRRGRARTARPERVLTTTLDRRRRVGAVELVLSARVRARLLRDGAVPRGGPAHGHRALRLRGVPRLAAPGRPDHPRRPRVDQDGADHPQALRPDARAQVGDLDGRVLQLDGRVQQLRARAGRQVHAGRRARARLPAAPRGADARDPQAAQDGPGRPRHGLARALRRRGTEEVVAAEGQASAVNVFEEGDTAGA